MAMVKPPSVIVFSVPPKSEITSTPATRDSGIASAEMNVERRLPRKRKRMTTTRIPPSRSATETLRIAISMKSAWRKFSFWITTPGRKGPLQVVQSTRSISRVSSRVFAPGCFWTLRMTAGSAAIGGRAPGGLGGQPHRGDLPESQGDRGPRPGARCSPGPRSTARGRGRARGTPGRHRRGSPRPGRRSPRRGPPTTSSTEIPAWTTAAGSSSTRYSRTSPPMGTTCEMPGTARRLRRTTVSAEPPQLHRGDVVGGQGDERDLAHDRADRSECRPLDAAREGDRLQALGHDLAGEVDVLAPLELDPDHRDARAGDRADASHAGGAVEGRLDREGHEELELLGRQPLGLGDDGDGGRREVREDVDGKARGQRTSGDQQHEGGREDRPSVTERASDHSVEHSPPLSGRGLRGRRWRGASCAARRPRPA